MTKQCNESGTKASFDISRADMRLVGDIADRAGRLFGFDTLALRMDMTACHANGCKIRLSDLLSADDFNFSHDILGINRHLHRNPGKLNDCFCPRYSA